MNNNKKADMLLDMLFKSETVRYIAQHDTVIEYTNDPFEEMETVTDEFSFLEE